jgi:hypothetical protein
MSETKLFIDCSGSTGNSSKYWKTVAGIIHECSDKDTFYFWDTTCCTLTKPEALYRAEMKRGGGGTSPECFAPRISPHDGIIIITDGQVYESSIRRCDDILKSCELTSVVVHFVSTGGSMNLSVSTPFTRNCKNFELYVDGESLASGDSTQEIDLKVYFNNPDKFFSEAEDLNKQIVVKNMGRRNDNLRNKLLDLQKNLMKCIAEENSSSRDEYEPLHQSLVNNNYEDSIYQIKALIGPSNSDELSRGKKLENIIRELTKLCEGTSNLSFTLLQPGRLTLANVKAPIKPDAVEEAPIEEGYKGIFECPIVLDNDLPVLLINNGPPVLADCEKNQLEAYMTNPLLMLLNRELVSKLKERIDHPIGLEATRELFKHGYVKSPMIRNPIHCALTFGNHHTHNKATNYSLANLFFGNKLVGLPELWLHVVYTITKQIPHLVENNGLMDAFKDHMLHRMKTKNTNMIIKH